MNYTQFVLENGLKILKCDSVYYFNILFAFQLTFV